MVDDVHDTVGGFHVKLNHFCDVTLRVTSEVCTTVSEVHCHILAFDGLDLLFVLEILGLDVAGGNVVGENSDELGLVLWFEEVLEDAFRERSKCFVGWRKHSEWAGSRESSDQVGGLEGGDQGREVWVGDGKFDNGFVGWRRCWTRSSWGEEDVVDHVHNTVAGFDVSLDNSGVVTSHASLNDDFAILEEDRDVGTFNGLDLLVVLEVLGLDVTRGYVVGENSDEFGLVGWFEEVLEHAFWECGKCFVGWRENGEWTSTFESGNQVGGFERSDQGGEVWNGSGELDNVHGWGHQRHEC